MTEVTDVTGSSGGAASSVGTQIACEWCDSLNDTDRNSCLNCGAPLTGQILATDSGWREAPRLGDMASFRFGRGICQVAGGVVPVAEVTLADEDCVLFESHAMLWKDEQVPLKAKRTGGGIARKFGGMPYSVCIAGGSGRIAFSRDSVAEVVVLPLAVSEGVDVRGHAFLAASDNVSYSFTRIKGIKSLVFGKVGMYLDHFRTEAGPGIVAIHGYGNVFERKLKAGEHIRVEPGGLLYKDPTVRMEVTRRKFRSAILQRWLYVLDLTGPGRVGIQSMYVHHKVD